MTNRHLFCVAIHWVLESSSHLQMTFPTHLQTPAHVCQLKWRENRRMAGKERFLIPAWMILMKPKSRGWCWHPLQLTTVYRTRIRKQRLDTVRPQQYSKSPDLAISKQFYTKCIKLKHTWVGLNCYVCRIQRRGNVWTSTRLAKVLFRTKTFLFHTVIQIYNEQCPLIVLE